MLENKKDSEYFVTVGLEVHAELNTSSKMWCSCKNDPFKSEPNTNVCPVCLAEPGALPVANLEALRKVVTVGMATGSNIANFTEFDRKNYFYPDMPKAYQISQYLYPVVSGGSLAGIELTRIHQEEDTAKSDHAKGGFTLLDFNRSGVPLMELVTEPITYNNKLEAAETSSKFCKELQRLLRTLNVSYASMEKGELRLEANISVTKDKNFFGTKCEVKNLNSFNSIERAIIYEVDRHIDLLEAGNKIIQETRGWDEAKLETYSQRKKENAHDYRYFPDPDLPKMYLHEVFDIGVMRAALPELPEEKRVRLLSLGLNEKQVETLLDDITLSNYYTLATEFLKSPNELKSLANYLLTDAVGMMSKTPSLKLPTPAHISTIVKMISDNKLSSRGAKDLLLDIMTVDADPEQRAADLCLIQSLDIDSLKILVKRVIEENKEKWQEYKNGEEKLEMFFVGKCMKEAAGSGNPKAFIEIIKTLS